MGEGSGWNGGLLVPHDACQGDHITLKEAGCFGILQQETRRLKMDPIGND